MAYLSEENTEMYRRMLSADDERGPVQSGLFTPPPRTQAPTPTTVGGFVKKSFKAPGAVMTKGIAITGTSGTGVGGGKTEVAPMPKSFSQAVITPTTTTTAQKFMPLVYIGGAGLLLYFLFKK
jgi:hypothetical protein